jgi:tetratricopeptide (TPR) repeat protein
MSSSKRLDVLLQATAAATADSFAFYALGMEYKSLGRVDEAITTFQRLRAKDPLYLPMYMMCGTMLASRSDRGAAREWLGAGLALARKQNNQHAANELEAALATIEP